MISLFILLAVGLIMAGVARTALIYSYNEPPVEKTEIEKITDFIISLHEANPQKWYDTYPSTSRLEQTELSYKYISREATVKMDGQRPIQLGISDTLRIKRLYEDYKAGRDPKTLASQREAAEELARRIVESAKTY